MEFRRVLFRSITSGTELSMGKKISIHQYEQHSIFILTSGLRSIRDKAVTYFEERLKGGESNLDRMYKAANAMSDEIRRCRTEDKQWLVDSGLSFDLHCLIGGQLDGDDEAHLFNFNFGYFPCCHISEYFRQRLFRNH